MSILPPKDRSPMERAELDAFAKTLNELMAVKGMSQSDVARAIWGSVTDNRGRDVARNRDRISNYCRGQQLPEPKTVRALAELFGVQVVDLHPPLALPPGPRAAPDMTMAVVGGRPDMALLTVNKMVPLRLAVQVLALLAEGLVDGEETK